MEPMIQTGFAYHVKVHVRVGLVKSFSLRPQKSCGRALLPLVNHQVPVVCLGRRVDDMDLISVLTDSSTIGWSMCP
jgi:hypothetical protein